MYEKVAGSGINSRLGAQVSFRLRFVRRRPRRAVRLPAAHSPSLQVLAESNYFNDVQNPIQTTLEGGYVVSKNNVSFSRRLHRRTSLIPLSITGLRQLGRSRPQEQGISQLGPLLLPVSPPCLSLRRSALTSPLAQARRPQGHRGHRQEERWYRRSQVLDCPSSPLSCSFSHRHLAFSIILRPPRGPYSLIHIAATSERYRYSENTTTALHHLAFSFSALTSAPSSRDITEDPAARYSSPLLTRCDLSSARPRRRSLYSARRLGQGISVSRSAQGEGLAEGSRRDLTSER